MLRAQKERQPSPGIAWDVRGSWKIDRHSAPIASGDSITPGALLMPDPHTSDDSITLLMPDGQRVLYECFLPENCARGFRVPALYRTPDPFAVRMLARVRAGLTLEEKSEEPDAHLRPRDEALVMLEAGNKVTVEGLVKALPNGRYTYALQRLDKGLPHQDRQLLEKQATSISISLPSSGLYRMTIADELNKPRIDMFLAAISPAQSANFTNSFREAKALLADWNTNYQGWPVHEFQRAYLRSLLLDIKAMNAPATVVSTEPEVHSDVTAEPRFSPKPGVFVGDTAVTLRCETPGAVMHYTVDGSQPFASSSVYGAPIIVKGTALTIKAFAGATGKKDSPVVTGIFRVGD